MAEFTDTQRGPVVARGWGVREHEELLSRDTKFQASQTNWLWRSVRHCATVDGAVVQISRDMFLPKYDDTDRK